MKRSASIIITGIATLAAAVLAFGMAGASISEPDGTLHGCYRTSGGALPVLGPAKGTLRLVHSRPDRTRSRQVMR